MTENRVTGEKTVYSHTPGAQKSSRSLRNAGGLYPPNLTGNGGGAKGRSTGFFRREERVFRGRHRTRAGDHVRPAAVLSYLLQGAAPRERGCPPSPSAGKTKLGGSSRACGSPPPPVSNGRSFQGPLLPPPPTAARASSPIRLRRLASAPPPHRRLPSRATASRPPRAKPARRRGRGSSGPPRQLLRPQLGSTPPAASVRGRTPLSHPGLQLGPRLSPSAPRRAPPPGPQALTVSFLPQPRNAGRVTARTARASARLKPAGRATARAHEGRGSGRQGRSQERQLLLRKRRNKTWLNFLLPRPRAAQDETASTREAVPGPSRGLGEAGGTADPREDLREGGGHPAARRQPGRDPPRASEPRARASRRGGGLCGAGGRRAGPQGAPGPPSRLRGPPPPRAARAPRPQAPPRPAARPGSALGEARAPARARRRRPGRRRSRPAPHTPPPVRALPGSRRRPRKPATTGRYPQPRL